MPVVQLQVIAGTTVEQKREIAIEITALLKRVVNSKPERTHIIFQEIARDNWAFDGGLVCDRQSQTK
jgi:4-oxalocrotonate tautomerase